MVIPKIVIPGLCPIHFTCTTTFAGQTNVEHYTRSIVIPKIVIPGFCPIHFTATFAGQTIVDHYTGNIVIPKIVKPDFHCITLKSYLSAAYYF